MTTDRIKKIENFAAELGIPAAVRTDFVRIVETTASVMLRNFSAVSEEVEERGRTQSDVPARPAMANVNVAVPIPPEARKLFGDTPATTRPRIYTKSNFPSDWFDNIEIVRAARRIVTTYKNRDKSIPVESDAQERYRTANRFMKAYESRQALVKKQQSVGGASEPQP